MNIAIPAKQRGITFAGLMMLAVALVLVGITVIRVVPAYMENERIKHAFNTISHDPEMQKASIAEIRNSFDKIASIDGITVIKGADVDVSAEDGMPYLSASYPIKVPLGGNVSLLLEFKPASAK